MDLSGNIGFLQQVEKVTSVGCNGLILIHVNVDFILWWLWLTTNFFRMYCLIFSCRAIGQRWLGRPNFSSRTIKQTYILYKT